MIYVIWLKATNQKKALQQKKLMLRDFEEKQKKENINN